MDGPVSMGSMLLLFTSHFGLALPAGVSPALAIACATALAIVGALAVALYRSHPVPTSRLGLTAAASNARPSATHDDETLSLEGTALAPIDRIFPAEPRAFLLLALLVGVGSWLIGMLLAPDVNRFLAAPEWRFMPFYLVTHLVAVRLFVTAFTRNFRAGIRNLEVPSLQAVHGVRLILGPVGILLAALIALPFCYLDFHYLTAADSRYERLGAGNTVATVDLWMWVTWCMEWLLNALIWLMLLAFMVKNCTIISRYPFRSPIEIVVHERHYRPFLRMSSQGATIMVGFSAVTIFYLWYTGGELTDYAGLGITTALLIIGFLPPWILLRRKVRLTVESETQALRHSLAGAMWRDAQHKKAGSAASSAPPLEQRLDEALAIFRISYLEHLKLNLGGHEARAILLRLLAPALGAAWQLSQNFESTFKKLDGVLIPIRAFLLRLLG